MLNNVSCAFMCRNGAKWCMQGYRFISRSNTRPKNDSRTCRSFRSLKHKRLSFCSATFLISSRSYETFQWERGEIFTRNSASLQKLIISSITCFPRLHSTQSFLRFVRNQIRNFTRIEILSPRKKTEQNRDDSIVTLIWK